MVRYILLLAAVAAVFVFLAGCTLLGPPEGCGNGKLDPGEACDTNPGPNYAGGCNYGYMCSSDCGSCYARLPPAPAPSDAPGTSCGSSTWPACQGSCYGSRACAGVSDGNKSCTCVKGWQKNRGSCGDGIIQWPAENCEIDADCQRGHCLKTFYSGFDNDKACRCVGFCGDGYVQHASGEECDPLPPGDLLCRVSGGDCGADCRCHLRPSPTPSPSASPVVYSGSPSSPCGDNRSVAGEQCDPPGSRCTNPFNSKEGTCSQNCNCRTSNCGNGVVEYDLGEFCETASDCAVYEFPAGTGCVDCMCIPPETPTPSPTSTRERPPLFGICGDNVRELGEDCDPPGSSCWKYGDKVGTCGMQCKCRLPDCGNGHVDPGEECETAADCSLAPGYACVDCNCVIPYEPGPANITIHSGNRTAGNGTATPTPVPTPSQEGTLIEFPSLTPMTTTGSGNATTSPTPGPSETVTTSSGPRCGDGICSITPEGRGIDYDVRFYAVGSYCKWTLCPSDCPPGDYPNEGVYLRQDESACPP